MGSDQKYMREALKLARKGIGSASPNPRVGAVVVSGGKIVGRGYHRGPGNPHAEAEAISDAKDMARGATLYLNLEPCCHYGKTPPCTEAIIAAGIGRVVFGIYDPDKRVCGEGCRKLVDNGIEVSTGVGALEAFELNLSYIHRLETGKPLVVLKMALTLDGRVGISGGGWFTSEQSRSHVHYLRSLNEAVAVGIGTVLADEPELDRRYFERPLPPPARVVFDTRLDFPPGSDWLGKGSRVLIYCGEEAGIEKEEYLREAGAEVIRLPSDREGLDLKAWRDDMSERGIGSVLVEGGAAIATSLIRFEMVDRLVLFQAPRLAGEAVKPWFLGDSEPGWIGRGNLRLSAARRLENDVVASYNSEEVERYFKKLAR